MLELTSPNVLGAVLRETRSALQIPAEDLAAMAGTSPVSLRRMEQGNPTAAIKTLFRLCDELGLVLQVSLPPGVDSIALPEENAKPRRTRVRT